MRPERKRLATALLLSVLIHALLLSLNSGGQRFGFPGFGFPWQDRRVEVPELHVVLAPPRAAAATPTARSAEPLEVAPIKPSIAFGPVDGPSVASTQRAAPTADEIVPEADQKAETVTRHDPATGPADEAAPPRAIEPSGAAPAPIPEPAVIAVERTEEAALVVPPPASVPSPVVAAARAASAPEAPDAARLEAERLEAAQLMAARRAEAEQETARQEAARIEAMRLEAERLEAAQQAAARRTAVEQEAARQEAARIEAIRLAAEQHEAAQQAAARRTAVEQEAARQEAARIEATRLAAEQQEAAQLAAARRAAAEQEAARRDAARVEAMRLEAERLEVARQAAARRAVVEQEASRQEAAQVEAARLEAARLEAERQEAMRMQAGQREAERREAARRAIGRQLDEEAAQREAAKTATPRPDTRPYSWSTARRGRLWGRTDPNSELVLYAEALARKIQFNTSVDVVREVAKRPHRDPLVTLAIRHDGSVESVTFDISSGVTEIDEAIRRIVQSQVPYQAFPPALARDFDVVEFRRTWHFDVAVRLY